MHPADASTLNTDSHPDVVIVADATLDRGHAAAELGEGLADLSIDAALARVKAALA
jgi:flagellar biosynthesis/type III secretory pathway protein FliH